MSQTFIVVLTICSIGYLSANEGTEEPLAEQDDARRYQGDLKRLVEDHRLFCRIGDSCNITHWYYDTYCYCKRCSCQADCVETDTCCPEVVTDLGNIPKPDIEIVEQCIPLSYRNLYSDPHQKMIASCPLSFKSVPENTEVVHKCEKRQESTYVIDILPVDDKTTDITYANKYCAECHSIQNTNLKHQWSAVIKCKTSIYTPTSFNPSLAEINATKDCDIVLTPRGRRAGKLCDKVISSCNETGLWKTFDHFTELACSSYNSHYMKAYRNPFCALCNGYDVKRYKRSTSNCGIQIPKVVPFSMLLDFRPDKKCVEPNFDGKCKEGQIYDTITNVCRDLFCEFGRILRNGSCERVFSQSKGFCYRIFVKLTALEGDTQDTAGYISRSTRHIPAVDLEVLATVFLEDIRKVAKNYGAHGMLRNITLYEINHGEKKNSSEVIFASMFFYISMMLANDGAFLDAMNEHYSNDNNKLKYSSMKMFKFDLVRLQEAATEDAIISPSTGELIFPNYSKLVNSHFEVACVPREVFIVTAFSFSPYIRLDNTSYTWDVNASGVTVHELNIFVRNALFRETDNESAIFVSIEVFKSALKNASGRRQFVIVASETEGIVSLVLMSISICCLLITFFTYSLFNVLRSQPGINNMILCLCLIFGFLIFMLGSSQPHLGLGCRILGGGIHYTWIFTFFWMNICSYHMYRVFGSINIPEQTSKSLSLTSLYLIYCTFSSSIIIGINIGVTYGISEGKSYGYGPEKTGICYISEPMMTLFTMAIPAICITIANILMFAVVVVRCRRVSFVKKHVQNNKNYFSIYVKLSTLTGMAWIVAVPMMLLQSIVFNYIFIALTCTQGIYFMVAFTCNKRVFKLYSGGYDVKKASGLTVYETHAVTRSKSSISNSDSVVVRSGVISNHI